jgi:hypothetical protein
MTSNVPVVMDTSALASAALLPRSVPWQAFDRALGQDTLLISLLCWRISTVPCAAPTRKNRPLYMLRLVTLI